MSGTESTEQILARHKKETRDLVATTTGMKKQATKSKRKEVLRKCQELEENLRLKHQREIEEIDGNANGSTSNVSEEEEITPEMLLAQLEISKKNEDSAETKTATKQEPQKKRNRQKERLARRDAAIAEARAEAASEASEQPDLRAIEMANLEQLCQMNGLKQHDIVPDGHCLFASIKDQLSIRQGISVTVQELRTRAANQMRDDPNTYAPFLFDEKTLTIRDMTSYSEEIENTAMWGGDIEIMALAKEFDCPISVMMSGAAALKINERGSQPELKLVYYKNSFGLGEHYNSLRDAVKEGETE